MTILTAAYCPQLDVHWGSDIRGLTWSEGVLVVNVAREVDEEATVRGLHVRFERAYGLRYLDELDLARYWTSEGFVHGHHMLEVLGGGWASEESALQGYEKPRREWLVVTGNGCVNVFADGPPDVTEASWPRDI